MPSRSVSSLAVNGYVLVQDARFRVAVGPSSRLSCSAGISRLGGRAGRCRRGTIPGNRALACRKRHELRWLDKGWQAKIIRKHSGTPAMSSSYWHFAQDEFAAHPGRLLAAALFVLVSVLGITAFHRYYQHPVVQQAKPFVIISRPPPIVIYRTRPAPSVPPAVLPAPAPQPVQIAPASSQPTRTSPRPSASPAPSPSPSPSDPVRPSPSLTPSPLPSPVSPSPPGSSPPALGSSPPAPTPSSPPVG
jgi:hypothetical protein